MRKKLKVDPIRLSVLLSDKGYYVNLLGGSPTQFEIYREKYTRKIDMLAFVASEQGFFGEYISEIVVWDKLVDEIFERLLGIDYYNVRIDNIK